MSKLDHDLIVDEAMRMIEADGEAGLSMRSLAAGLNVTPMALYRYFADRDALLLALVVRVSETLEFPERTSDPRADAVALALTLHDFLALHPWMIRLISTGRLASPAGMRFPEGFLDCAAAAGLDDERAFLFYRTMLAAILGAATITSAAPAGAPSSLPDTSAVGPLPRVTGLASRWTELDRAATPAAILAAIAATLQAS
ncbi:TetR/AcrR family transcriptional regulator [Leucobacter sp. G161]|uniref:TetR/AcrR family transcriptional regulator n=1 Tax=Leucobacter sp. G161 TaxID=663704 RepID=UPI00073CB808|nr:TetR/AcrR family transcriptional regulator [Leucobacter sp. G161]KUF06495.1 TetR family transcriptional regulator [Leucobacter sp. G161]